MRNVSLKRRPVPARPVQTAYAENFERVPESAAAARRLVSRALEVWDLPQLADSAVLIMAELVSNTVRHAQGEGMRVHVMLVTDRRVRVSVLDRDSTRPQMRNQESDDDEEGGRGLYIVDAESVSWGVDLLPGGKRVWADLELGAS
jgi:anti-sigma regulatory factor (Ser/Thr protein kinase)